MNVCVAGWKPTRLCRPPFPAWPPWQRDPINTAPEARAPRRKPQWLISDGHVVGTAVLATDQEPLHTAEEGGRARRASLARGVRLCRAGTRVPLVPRADLVPRAAPLPPRRHRGGAKSTRALLSLLLQTPALPNPRDSRFLHLYKVVTTTNNGNEQRCGP